MKAQFLLIIAMEDMALIIAGIIYLYIMLKGRFGLKAQFPQFYKENGKIIIAVRIIAGIVLIYVFFGQIIPDIKDIPYIMSEEYDWITGKALCNSMSNSRGSREVKIESEDGEVIRVVIHSKCSDIKIGDSLTAKYLPNSKRGIITRHVPGGQENEN